MSGRFAPPQHHADLTEEAAAWLAALDAGSADVAEFEAWRDRDVRHAIAFAQVADTWRDMDGLRVTQDDLNRSLPNEVQTGEAETVEQPARRHMLKAAASIAALAVIGGGFGYRAYARNKATTAVGQRQTVAATPAMKLDLNTDSCVYWKDGAPARLWLERGEVAIGLAGGQRLDLIAADGTFRLEPGAYNVRLRETGCELAVLAGAITHGASTRIGPGETALAAAGRVNVHSRDGADLSRITAWQQDTLVLSGESLDYALAEMNRYLPHKIVIGDPALSRLRLGGTFSTTNPDEFLQALRGSFGVKARAGANGGTVLTRT